MNEADALERMADWRIRKVGEDPSDRQSAEAAKLLHRLSEELRSGGASSARAEYVAILNWLGEFDVMEDFAERAHEYRLTIGMTQFPEDADAYLRALSTIAKETAGV